MRYAHTLGSSAYILTTITLYAAFSRYDAPLFEVLEVARLLLFAGLIGHVVMQALRYWERLSPVLMLSSEHVA